jgi:hypothetical protein
MQNYLYFHVSHSICWTFYLLRLHAPTLKKVSRIRISRPTDYEKIRGKFGRPKYVYDTYASGDHSLVLFHGSMYIILVDTLWIEGTHQHGIHYKMQVGGVGCGIHVQILKTQTDERYIWYRDRDRVQAHFSTFHWNVCTFKLPNNRNNRRVLWNNGLPQLRNTIVPQLMPLHF